MNILPFSMLLNYHQLFRTKHLVICVNLRSHIITAHSIASHGLEHMPQKWLFSCVLGCVATFNGSPGRKLQLSPAAVGRSTQTAQIKVCHFTAPLCSPVEVAGCFQKKRGDRSKQFRRCLTNQANIHVIR